MPRPIEDQQQGMPTGVVSAPASWSFDSRVVWNYAHHGNPVTVSMRAQNPQNEEAVFRFPAEMYFRSAPTPWLLSPGPEHGRSRVHAEGSGLQALAAFIQRTRSDVGALEFAGCQELPGSPKGDAGARGRQAAGLRRQGHLRAEGQTGRRGVLRGRVNRSRSLMTDPKVARFRSIRGLTALHSFRAPAGTLDRRRPVFAAIAKSYRPNPAWMERLGGINRYLAAEFNRQLQAGYDQIAAAAPTQPADQREQRRHDRVDRMTTAGLWSNVRRWRLERQRSILRLHPRRRNRRGSLLRHLTALARSAVSLDGWIRKLSQHECCRPNDPNHTEVGNWTPMRAVPPRA